MCLFHGLAERPVFTFTIVLLERDINGCGHRSLAQVDKSGRHDVEKTVVEVPFWETERNSEPSDRGVALFKGPFFVTLSEVPLFGIFGTFGDKTNVFHLLIQKSSAG